MALTSNAGGWDNSREKISITSIKNYETDDTWKVTSDPPVENTKQRTTSQDCGETWNIPEVQIDKQSQAQISSQGTTGISGPQTNVSEEFWGSDLTASAQKDLDSQPKAIDSLNKMNEEEDPKITIKNNGKDNHSSLAPDKEELPSDPVMCQEDRVSAIVDSVNEKVKTMKKPDAFTSYEFLGLFFRCLGC